MKALAAAALGLHWSNIMVMVREVMLWLYYGCAMVILWLLLWLLCQPGENKCVFSSYSSLSLITAF